MRRLIAIAVVAGCYAPKVEQGSPCDEASPCPTSLACIGGHCLAAGTEILADAADGDASSTACVPSGPEICGDGIDQDCAGGDAVCPDNDQPAGAIDVTAGGTWMTDLELATDDLASLAAPGCNADGGRDVFYQVTLTAPEVYAFDTFGAGFDTSLRVFPGLACTALTDRVAPGACSDDVCGTGASQVGAALPVGTSCVVLDQNANQTRGKTALHVIRGRRTGAPVLRGTAQLHGDTCASQDLASSGCGEDGAKDIAYWFLACPGKTTLLDANTCGAGAETAYDAVLWSRRRTAARRSATTTTMAARRARARTIRR